MILIITIIIIIISVVIIIIISFIVSIIALIIVVIISACWGFKEARFQPTFNKRRASTLAAQCAMEGPRSTYR